MNFRRLRSFKDFRYCGVCAALVLAGVLGGAKGEAQVLIPGSERLTTIPAALTSGLNADYYSHAWQTDNNGAAAYMISNAPTATFVSTTLDYPSIRRSFFDTNPLSQFLNVDAASLSDPAVGSNTLEGQMMHFTGFVDIETAGTYMFSMESDDGSRLNIGGITVADNAGIHGYRDEVNHATFTDAGLYPLDIIYYEQQGEAGIALVSDLTGTEQVVPGSLLYRVSVPEPGSVTLLMAVGVCAMGVRGLRRRNLASTLSPGRLLD